MAQIDFENLLKQRMGLDSVSVGSATIERAVRLRMATLGTERIEDYWQRLRGSNDELQELIETVVVPETWFFRDQEAFRALVRLVVEEWRPLHPAGVLRALSIPCSTGEEPYSIVMALLDGGFSGEQLHVDAVDISARALARAKRAVYGMNSFRSQNIGFRERYFRSTLNGYALVEGLREKVNFHQENLLSPESRFAGEPYDVVFCRNLLIYFDRTMQEQAMRTLGRLLAPSGFLFVGPAEAFLASGSGFASVNQAMSFAFRRTPAKRVTPPSASFAGTVKPVIERPRGQRPAKTAGVVPLLAQPVPQVADLESVRHLADAGKLGEAVESCESHLRQHGPSAEAYYLLGLVRDAIGDRHDAAESYRKALYLAPDHMEALIHLALLSEREGNIAGGSRLRERARRVEHTAELRTS
jgi:chemotaxis protein methyltransferase WspC